MTNSTNEFRAPLPPRPRPEPGTPFEQWMRKQAKNGHDRLWLRHNAERLKRRFEHNSDDLPPPKPSEVVRNRYDELG